MPRAVKRKARRRDLTPASIRACIEKLRLDKDSIAVEVVAKHYLPVIISQSEVLRTMMGKLVRETIIYAARTYKMDGRHGTHFGQYLHQVLGDVVAKAAEKLLTKKEMKRAR